MRSRALLTAAVIVSMMFAGAVPAAIADDAPTPTPTPSPTPTLEITEPPADVASKAPALPDEGTAAGAAAATLYTLSGVVSFGTTGSHPAGVTARVTWTDVLAGTTGYIDTDAAGNFAFSLPPGAYRIQYRPSSAAYQTQYWNQRDRANTSYAVDLWSASAVANATLPVLGSIAGTVFLGTTSTPAGAGQVKVTAFRCYEDGCVSGQEPTTLTDAAGGYSFPALGNGVYTLKFTYLAGAGYQPAADKVVTVSNSQQVFTGQNVTMPVAASITGTVTLGSSAVVAGANEVWVAAFRESTASLVYFPTDAAGKYTIPGLAAGSYRLSFDYRGTRGFADEYYPAVNNTYDAVSTSVTTGATVRNVTLTPGLTLNGTVRDTQGAPLAGIWIELATETGGHSSYTVMRGETAADGTYSFTNLLPNVWLAFTSQNGNYRDFGVGEWSGTGPFQAGTTRTRDVTMYLYTSVSGRITCTNCDLSIYSSNIGLAIERNTGTTGSPVWIQASYGELYPSSESRYQAVYSTPALLPGEYRIRIRSLYAEALPGNASVLPEYSAPFTVEEGVPNVQDRTISFSGSLSLTPGALVKSTGGPAIYFWSGSQMYPVSSMSTVAEMGLPTTYTTVTPAQLATYTTTTVPLQPVLYCNSQWWLAVGGKLWSTTQRVVGYYEYRGMLYTEIPGDLCDRLPKSPTALGDLAFIKASNSPAVYQLSLGRLWPILRGASLSRLSGGAPYTILTGTPAFVASIPRGPEVVEPGMLVKTAASPAVYLVDEYLNLIPVPSFEPVVDMGLPTTISIISSTALAEGWVAPTPLRSVVTCNGETWLATGGKLVRVASGIIGSLAATPLSDALCAVIPKASGPGLTSTVIVKSPSSAALYQLVNGTKRSIGSGAALALVTGGSPVVITTVGSTFLTSVPSGADVLPVGALVKTASSAAVYLYDGSGLFPLSSFDPITGMGLPTAITVVSPATMTSLSVASSPLRNVVTCGGETWLAAGGRLTRIPAAAVGSYSPSALPSALCAIVTKASGPGLSSPVFLKSASAPAVFQFIGGVKRPVTSGAALARIAAGAPVVITVVGPAFLASLPTGTAIN